MASTQEVPDGWQLNILRVNYLHGYKRKMDKAMGQQAVSGKETVSITHQDCPESQFSSKRT